MTDRDALFTPVTLSAHICGLSGGRQRIGEKLIRELVATDGLPATRLGKSRLLIRWSDWIAYLDRKAQLTATRPDRESHATAKADEWVRRDARLVG